MGRFPVPALSLASVPHMLSPFSSTPSTESPSPRRLARYGLYLVGAMVALWVGGRAVTMSSPTAPSTSQPTDTTMTASSPASGGEAGIEVFTWGNVAAVLVLAGGGAYALYLRQNGGGTASTSLMRPLDQMSLGPSKHLRLVACGGKVLLLGVTDDEVTLLKTYARDAFGDLEAVDATDDALPSMGAATDSANATPEGFSDVLNRFARTDARS